MRRKSSGFTMIEFLILITIFAIFAAVFVPFFLKRKTESTQPVRVQSVQENGRFTVNEIRERVELCSGCREYVVHRVVYDKTSGACFMEVLFRNGISITQAPRELCENKSTDKEAAR